MVSDRDRRTLQFALEAHLGEGRADTLMELLPPVGWADLARQSDLVAIRGQMTQLGASLHGEMAQLATELRGEMAELRTGLRDEMAHLRTGLRGEMAHLRTGLRGEMADLKTELRGEMAALRSEVHGQLPKFVAANVPLMFATAGLVLAAAKLA